MKKERDKRAKGRARERVGTWIYRAIEVLDGETGKYAFIAYPIAQKIKLLTLEVLL